jgi:starch synthase
MKILMVTPELDPFVKVGGLGDMVGALAKQLARQGHDVRCVVPLYGSVKRLGRWECREQPLGADLAGGAEFGRVWTTVIPGSEVTTYFIEHERFFARPEVYSTAAGSFPDNDRRFIFFTRAALNLCLQLGWMPDVIHCHDWTCGFVPVWLNTTDRDGPLGRSATVFTIHNLEHQGYCHRNALAYAKLPEWLFTANNVEACGAVNLMKAGLYHSTKITTVSPTYAREIQTPAFGFGLDYVLRFRSGDLIGILNGIDTEAWNPATDPHLPASFDATDIAGKAACKAALQRELGLDVDPRKPVFGVVSRLFRQKGLDLLCEVLPSIVTNMQAQFAILGTGDADLEEDLCHTAIEFPGRVGLKLAFDNRLAHLIQGGSDFFVMPSRTEPCGLTQLYAMRYGTLPVARATGGLVDTIEQYREGTGEGTGFLFDSPDLNAVYHTVGWANATYYDRPDEFAVLRTNAMARDFSWANSADRYAQVYGWASDARLSGFAGAR